MAMHMILAKVNVGPTTDALETIYVSFISFFIQFANLVRMSYNCNSWAQVTCEY